MEPPGVTLGERSNSLKNSLKLMRNSCRSTLQLIKRSVKRFMKRYVKMNSYELGAKELKRRQTKNIEITDMTSFPVISVIQS